MVQGSALRTSCSSLAVAASSPCYTVIDIVGTTIAVAQIMATWEHTFTIDVAVIVGFSLYCLLFRHPTFLLQFSLLRLVLCLLQEYFQVAASEVASA